jgi:hypothetical protein
MLAGSNVFGGNLLFAFIHGKRSKRGADPGISSTRAAARCTLQPHSGINACSKT